MEEKDETKNNELLQIEQYKKNIEDIYIKIDDSVEFLSSIEDNSINMKKSEQFIKKLRKRNMRNSKILSKKSLK